MKIGPAVWVVVMITATAAYAAVHVSSKTGAVEIHSKALGTVIDLTMATPADGNCAGASYAGGDLSTALLALNNAVSGQVDQTVTVCVRNGGDVNRTAQSRVLVTDLVNAEEGCTGDESTVDGSCGATGVGELLEQLRLVPRDCTSNIPNGTHRVIDWNGTQPVILATPPGQTSCFRIQILWPQQGWQSELMAQSDVAAWRFQVVSDPV